MVLFSRQMSTMITAGIPLLEALEIMVEQTDNKGFAAVLNQVVEDVRTGSDLSSALARYPRIFPPLYTNMIKAGEASGQLDVIMQRLAGYQESMAQLRRRIKSAMTYPVVSLTLVLGITTFLMVVIVPKFKDIFDTLRIDLPGITRFILNLSTALRRHFVKLLIGIVAFVIGAVIYAKTEFGGRQMDWLKLNLPIVGDLFRKVAISRFTKTLSTLLRSGVPILGALEIVAGTSGNRVIAEAVSNSRDNVRQGETLAEPLAASGVFPPMVTRMIAIGEKSGALEELLEKVSVFYEQQVEAAVDGLTSMIEPLLIVAMGVMVGGVVLSIFLPILKIQEVLQKTS
jgi:type IV pilus assembly protein PilC